MKNYYKPAILILISTLFQPSTQAQSFGKGSLLISISEGVANADFSTRKSSKEQETLCKKRLNGERDPLIVEFGLTDRWGVGFSSGLDFFRVDPKAFYGFNGTKDRVKVAAADVNAEVHYHLLTSDKFDLSAFGSLGLFNVSIDDKPYKYDANGLIVRGGTKVRYYFYRNWGVLGMLSTYSGSASPKYSKEGNVAKNYSTTIKGYAIEFGLCYHFAEAFSF